MDVRFFQFMHYASKGKAFQANFSKGCVSNIVEDIT